MECGENNATDPSPHLWWPERAGSPVVLNLFLPHVQCLPRSFTTACLPLDLGTIHQHIINALLTTLLAPKEVVLCQNAPVAAGLGCVEQVPWLKEGQYVQGQLS